MTEEINVAKALQLLAEAIDKATDTINSLDKADIHLVLKAYKQLGDYKERFEQLDKIVSGLHKKMSNETVPEALEAQGLDSVKSGGYNFIIAARLSASIPEEKREEGFKWLADHGMDYLIRPAVNSRSLSTALKSYMEEKGETPPEDAVTVFNQKYTQVRRA